MVRHLTRPYFLESCRSEMLVRVISDGFRWFAVLVVTPSSQHTEEFTLYCTHGHT